MEEKRQLLVECPVCGFDCVHLESVLVNKGAQDITITKSGIIVDDVKPVGRGSIVQLMLWCESGHKWIEHTQFHKGSLMRWHTPIIEDSSTVNETALDLWRD